MHFHDRDDVMRALHVISSASFSHLEYSLSPPASYVMCHRFPTQESSPECGNFMVSVSGLV